METYKLMKKVREPGARGEYLKDSEKVEMYRLYKENLEVNTVEKLAKDYRVMRQRVHAILWLKEMEEEEKRIGKPLDDSVEILLDNFPDSDLDWTNVSSWSTGLTKVHFDGNAVGHQSHPQSPSPPIFSSAKVIVMDEEEEILMTLELDNKESKKFVDGWDERMMETYKLMKQVREPGARGEYLKDWEKAEMYRLYKDNLEVNTVEKLAKDYRVMRQRVHAILWLKEMEEEKRIGKPLDDPVEILLDNFLE